MSPYTLPSAREVEKAVALITQKVTATPTKTSSYFLTHVATTHVRQCNHTSASPPTIQLFLKCENLQKIGSFKFCSATHFLARLNNEELANGVVAYSTGNHAQAVAHAAHLASREHNMPVPAYVVVPSNCPAKKINAARSYNASVFLADAPPNRVRLAAKISDSTGAVLVPPADHVDIVLGQATAVRELLQQVADMGQRLDAIVVPSGGGGLLVGAVTVCASQGVAVFGAEPEHGGPGLALALQTGQRCVEVNGSPTIADGLRSVTGEANWEHISRKGNVKGAFTVTEEQIKEALRLVVEEMGVLIEPSAAVGVAVALFSPGFAREMARFKGCARIGVLTGANIGVTDVLTLIPNMEMDSVLQK